MNTDKSTLELIHLLSSDTPQNNIKLSKNNIIEEIEGHLIVNNYDQEVIAMLYWGFIYFKAKLNSIRENPPDHWRENVIACHKAKAYLQPKYRPIEQPDNNLFNIDLPLQETSPNKTITNKLNAYMRVYRTDLGLDTVKTADDIRLLYETHLREYLRKTPGATKHNFLTFKLLEVDKLLNAIEINNFSVSNAGWLVIYKQILEDENKKLNDRIKAGDDIVAKAVKGKPEKTFDYTGIERKNIFKDKTAEEEIKTFLLDDFIDDNWELICDKKGLKTTLVALIWVLRDRGYLIDSLILNSALIRKIIYTLFKVKIGSRTSETKITKEHKQPFVAIPYKKK